MFENLIESRPTREKSLRQSVLSALIHAVLIVAAVRVTTGAAEGLQDDLKPEVVFLQPKAPPPPPPPVHTVSQPVTRQPTALGFQLLPVVMDVPITIPPVDLSPSLDPKAYTTGIGKPGGIPDGVIGGQTGIADIIRSEAYAATEVDDPVQRIGGPELRYPPMLRTVGMSGTVVLEFVVGADGKAESASIKVISTTDERFNYAATENVLAATYKPAKMRGTPVRQLVRQNVLFTVSSEQ